MPPASEQKVEMLIVLYTLWKAVLKEEGNLLLLEKKLKEEREIRMTEGIRLGDAYKMSDEYLVLNIHFFSSSPCPSLSSSPALSSLPYYLQNHYYVGKVFLLFPLNRSKRVYTSSDRVRAQ